MHRLDPIPAPALATTCPTCRGSNWRVVKPQDRTVIDLDIFCGDCGYKSRFGATMTLDKQALKDALCTTCEGNAFKADLDLVDGNWVGSWKCQACGTPQGFIAS